MTELAALTLVPLGPKTRTEFIDLMEVIRDEHLRLKGCNRKGAGRSNKERSNQRRVTTLSKWIRDVPGIRTIDVDQLAYCPHCVKPLVWIEVKPYHNRDEWQVARELARDHKCYAMLVVERDDRFHNIVIYHPDASRVPPC